MRALPLRFPSTFDALYSYIVSRPWAWRALRRTAWPSPSCVCYVCVPLGLRAQRLRSGRTPVRDTASYTFGGDGGKIQLPRAPQTG